jgi:hypothetical protein
MATRRVSGAGCGGSASTGLESLLRTVRMLKGCYTVFRGFLEDIDCSLESSQGIGVVLTFTDGYVEN